MVARIVRTLPTLPTEPNPLREQLARTIVSVQTLTTSIADIEERQRSVQADYWAARRSLEEAQAKTQAAEDMDATAFVNGADVGALSAHRRVLEVLADKTAAAKNAQNMLASRHGQLTSELDWAQRKRDAALNEVVKSSPTVRRLVARFRQAQRELHETRVAISTLPHDARPNDVLDFDIVNWTDNLPPSSVAKRVEDWLARLKEDASAELE